tara:strand:- start:251 stop:526 length:276 start_codon:yes stop_codon:yes gene_type:complete
VSILAIGYLSIVVLLFSGNLLVGKLAIASLPPLTLSLGRMVVMFVAVLILFGPAAWRQRRLLLNEIKASQVVGAVTVITGVSLVTLNLRRR